MPKLATPPPLFLETQKNATAYTERSESTSQHISSPCLASPPPPAGPAMVASGGRCFADGRRCFANGC